MAAAPTPQPVAAAGPRRAVNLIVIHCSATASGQWLGGAPGSPGRKRPVDVIDAWHAERGFQRQGEAVRLYNPELPHIGYHAVIDLDGTVYTGRGYGEAGAHAKGFNTYSLGLCLVGGAERAAQYTLAQWRALAQTVRGWATMFRVPLLPPRVNGAQVFGGVCGHRDLSPDLNHDGRIEPNEWLKTCPGFEVSAWLQDGLQPQAGQIWSAP